MNEVQNETIEVPGVRLGKLPAKSNVKALLFDDFLKKAEIVVPSSYDFWRTRTAFPLRTFGNTQYGCCVVEGTQVLAPRKQAAYKVSYAGPVVTLITESGRRLTVTPNHTILTPRGFVVARLLQKGDHTICGDFQQGAGVVDANFNKPPSVVEQVFSAFLRSASTSRHLAQGWRAKPDNFHGDGRFMNGHVDVVYANSFLQSESNPALSKPNSHNQIGTAGKTQIPLHRFGSASHSSPFSGLPSFSKVGVLCQGFAFADSHSQIPQSDGPRQGTSGDAGLFQSSFENLTSDTIFTAETFHRLTRLIPLKSLSQINQTVRPLFTDSEGEQAGLTTVPDWYASPTQPVEEGRFTDAQLPGKLVSCFPGCVSVERIIDIFTEFWVGHVYDFSTEQNWYVANGIIIHNCTIASQAISAMRMERLETRQTPKITDQSVIDTYLAMTARLYGGGDTGAYETDALSNWRNPDSTFRDSKGRPLTIDAFTRINHFDHGAVRQAFYITAGKGIKLCFNLPAAWARRVPPDTWDIPEGQALVGEWMPGSWGGHSMHAPSKYNAQGFWINHTWGMPDQFVTWRAAAIYMDEVHWVVDSLNAWRKAPLANKFINLNKLADAVNSVSDIKIK